MRLRHLALITLFIAGGARAELPEPVARLAYAAGIPEEAIGAIVLRGDTILVSHEADQPMLPASTMKVITAVVALEQLGPAFRGRTELRSKGDIVNGVLKGDLLVRGGADMDLNEDTLRHLLEDLRARGVQRIAGDLVLDRQLFQPPREDIGKPRFDESPEARYNVVPDALLLNMNMLRVDMDSTGNRGPNQAGVRTAALPELDRVTVRSAQTLVDADCANWDAGWKPPTIVKESGRLAVVLHGTFPRNCRQTYSINVLDRDDYADRLVRATWKQLGGTIAGTTRAVDLAEHTSSMAAAAAAQGAIGAADDSAAPAARQDGANAGADADGTRLLAQHVSRALPELVRDTMKVSDNALARMLYLSLGSLLPDETLGSRPLPAGQRLAMLMANHGGGEASGMPATTQARAEAVIRGWFKRHGIDDSGMVLENGSGLSRTERLRPVQLAAVLNAAGESPWAPEFQASLPIVGVDGTMKRRLKGSQAASRARIKTGTLRDGVAVAGYVPDANGEQCIVVAIINHSNMANGVGRGIVDALIDWTANSSSAPAM
ncbi:D-alanyl-D-alanine carboxypeptidase/D-alanyl-D-alanine-endopeptidase [Massilia dura]|uniref:D-alanyl-D-alanine carboxypeptidase/D-alanyl-D-alanine-endopeptidase n=1 Tax=Pseudoduganella dura TaxID=321982 RepID=A0A6I3X9T4_9BURK|nr:D-alanyl-D-alanine carboxypeptidase/D-alanyl-D-alanine-endopeptidase [Pseudoduganella dura]MUI13619.1 D-alanyl-D-alanine carboxypeptidase/D-alanyl-D-alanine-endopeptidase [Pseudoduganella dura]GGX74133.1 D-alanyl-D-alanine carboxypeptidase [Pseudoduganella dura]